MKAAIILAVIILGMVAACCPKIVNQSSTTIRDSVVISTKVVYDTVRVASDSSAFTFDWMTLAKDPDSTMEKKSGRADLVVRKNHGRFTASCECDTVLIIKKFRRPDTTHYNKKITNNTGLKPVFVTSKFDTFCHWWFFITAAILVGGATLKLAKFF